ncbi:MAG: 7-cyano-7-deazaguanine synthase QueC [Planctomycetota bacterium]
MIVDATQRAVVLLSGGLDSTTTLAIARDEGFEPYAMTFRYGQRHAAEVDAALEIGDRMGVARHVVCDIDLRQFGGSALTDDWEVPQAKSVDDIGCGIPVTYVPARNTIFLSFALAWAETLSTGHIFIGVNSLDYSGYPDCRPEYIAAFQTMANLATKGGVEKTCPITIHTPLMHLGKGEIIRRGLTLGVDYSLTTSCYAPSPEGVSCGSCDACLLRLRGFAENKVSDPIRYRAP